MTETQKTDTEFKPSKLGLFMINLLHIATGVRVERLHLYHTVGDDVTLPCGNVIPVYPECSSTTWLYNRDTRETLFVVTLGNIRATENPAGDRLSLNPNCSLTVQRITAQDSGVYICQQFDSTGSRYGVEEQVYLSLLNISPSPPVTDLKPGTPVTLTCSLFIIDVNTLCDQHIIIKWLDGAGGKVLKSNQEEISGERRCSISLTVTLLEEDNNNRKFRCQLTDRRGNQETFMETFIDFLVLFSGSRHGAINSGPTQTPAFSSVLPRGGDGDQKDHHSNSSFDMSSFNLWLRIVLFLVLTCVVIAAMVTTRKRDPGAARLPTAALAPGTELQVLEG